MECRDYTEIDEDKKMKVIAATGNKNKLIEFQEILKPFNIEITTFENEGYDPIEVVEDGTTFEENSYKKAREIMEATGMAAIADDSGLEVDALLGAPGVYSARFAGENAGDRENNLKLMELLKDVPEKDRSAQFHCVITLIFTDGERIIAEGIVSGHMITEPRGDKGFGYDPLFIPEGYEKTFGELENEAKNRISHRGKALRQLMEELKNRDSF